MERSGKKKTSVKVGGFVGQKPSLDGVLVFIWGFLKVCLVVFEGRSGV